MNTTFRDPETDPAFSLTSALGFVARRAGTDLDRDDLHAALGLSLMICAVPGEPDLARWITYARDAFLPQAASLFGMTVRDLHPPRAAHGLHRAAEFAQHFEASYAPLVRRALENGQPVLAWQGWEGQADGLWGVIESTTREGVGFAGRPFPASAPSPASPLPLTRPPTQVYVVEAPVPRTPREGVLVAQALELARRTINNTADTVAGAVTGLPALDAWIDWWTTALESADAMVYELVAAHIRLTASIAAGHRSAQRFFAQHQPASPAPGSLLVHCAGLAGKVADILANPIGSKPARAKTGAEIVRKAMTAPLTRVRAVVDELRVALERPLPAT
ncbi:MAG: hypothetical protein HY763_08340 [Planctomycetes bacterium]|nr:hypothetical protein [Planctomycetota bacterium]